MIEWIKWLDINNYDEKQYTFHTWNTTYIYTSPSSPHIPLNNIKQSHNIKILYH